MNDNKPQNKINKRDLTKMFWRMQIFQGSWNYERMQNLAYLFCMKPVLKKIYNNKPKEEKVKAIKRHLEFFNTMPTLAAPIMGVTAAMEEQGGNEVGQAISSVKVGLMGPLAGLGDSIIWLTWMPICMSIAASFTSQGNPLGLILGLLMFNIVNVSAKYYGISFGYEKGVNLLEETKDSGIIQRYTTMATILGLTLIGGLIPQMVSIKIPLTLAVGEVKVVVQEILDGIMPSLVPLLVTYLCYHFIKKGRPAVGILVVIILASILCKWVGILG